jgi:menaquinone-dependent protoporphyrinogen oxidase
MRVLVAHASRHGATAGIAERIAKDLEATGLTVTVGHVEDFDRVDTFDAVIVGGAIYIGSWLKPATKFVKHHHEALAGRPVWLFGSGPVGEDTIDEHGTDILDASRPKEFDALETLIGPRGTQIFFGAYDPDAEPLTMAERALKLMPAAKAALPAGDFRDWDAIDAWADAIAHHLTEATV